MTFFIISTKGDLDDRSLCILENRPEGAGGNYYYLKKGIRLGEKFPHKSNYYMDDGHPGIRLCSFISNLCSLLIFSSEVVNAIKQVCDNDIEYLPFTLINHEKSIASEDYFIVNPIGTFDCLNEKASNIKYTSTGHPIEPRTYILDPAKMKGAPHLFRIKDFPYAYVMDITLAQKIKAQKLSQLPNLIVYELDQLPSEKADIEKREFAKKAKKLEIAALEGKIEEVKNMIASGMPVNEKTWEDADRAGVPYNTPLSAAVIGGHTDIINFVLDAGAPVNEVNCDSTTSFLEAAFKGNLEIMKKLASAGADVHQSGEKGNAILYLFKKNDDASGESSDIDVLKYLLDHGVDPSEVLSEYKYHADNIEGNNPKLPIRKPYLDVLELLQILADNWKKGSNRINAIIKKCEKVIQKIKDKNAAPPIKPTASTEKIEKLKTIVLDIFHGSFDVDWDEEKILNTNVMDEFEEVSDGFYDYMREVLNLDDYDEDELEAIFEGTVSEIMHKIAEVWGGQKK